MQAKLQPTVIVLAAGRGERFTASGGQTRKLNALLGSKTVLEHTVDAVRASGLPFVVVQATDNLFLGIGDSIARGIGSAPSAAGWLILPADLPRILPATMLAVAQALQTQGGVVQPYYENQAAHPVGFSAECGAALRALSGDVGARSVVQHYRAAGHWLRLDVQDAGVLQDVDTVADLLALQ